MSHIAWSKIGIKLVFTVYLLFLFAFTHAAQNVSDSNVNGNADNTQYNPTSQAYGVSDDTASVLEKNNPMNVPVSQVIQASTDKPLDKKEVESIKRIDEAIDREFTLQANDIKPIVKSIKPIVKSIKPIVKSEIVRPVIDPAGIVVPDNYNVVDSNGDDNNLSNTNDTVPIFEEALFQNNVATDIKKISGDEYYRMNGITNSAHKAMLEVDSRLSILEIKKNTLNMNIDLSKKQRAADSNAINKKKEIANKKIRDLNLVKRARDAFTLVSHQLTLKIKDMHGSLANLYEQEKSYIKFFVNYSNLSLKIIAKDYTDIADYAKSSFEDSVHILKEMKNNLSKLSKIPVLSTNSSENFDEKKGRELLNDCFSFVHKLKNEENAINKHANTIISTDTKNHLSQMIVPKKELSTEVQRMKDLQNQIKQSQQKILEYMSDFLGKLSTLIKLKIAYVEKKLIAKYQNDLQTVYSTAYDALANKYELERTTINKMVNNLGLKKNAISANGQKNIQERYNDIYEKSSQISRYHTDIEKLRQSLYEKNMANKDHITSLTNVYELLTELQNEYDLSLLDKKVQLEKQQIRILRKERYESLTNVIVSMESFNDLYNKFLSQKEAVCNEIIGQISGADKNVKNIDEISEMISLKIDGLSRTLNQYNEDIEEIILKIGQNVFVTYDDMAATFAKRNNDTSIVVREITENLNKILLNVDELIGGVIKSSKNNLIAKAFDYEIKALQAQKHSMEEITNKLMASKSKIFQAFDSGDKKLEKEIGKLTEKVIANEEKIRINREQFLQNFEILKNYKLPNEEYIDKFHDYEQYTEFVNKEQQEMSKLYAKFDEAVVDDLRSLAQEEASLRNYKDLLQSKIYTIKKRKETIQQKILGALADKTQQMPEDYKMDLEL